MEGGSGFDSINPNMPTLLPEGYEAGTPPTPAIVALGSGIDFINKIGIEEIKYKLERLTVEALSRLENIPSIKIYKAGIGLISFNVADKTSSYIASELDKRGICVRGGLHCAPSVHRRLNTLSQGAVRISFSYLNKTSEIDAFYKAIKSITKDI